MNRILIADDEAEIRSLLRLYLENEGYEVEETEDGNEALKILAGKDIDLCLLDIMLPGMDGFHVLQKLRQTSDIPVIIISAKDTDPDKILGLDLGADDYIAKPFNPLEAMARVRSNLRRYAARTGTAETEGSSGHRTLSHRDLVLDLDACCIYKNDERIDLTSVEFRIMNMFMASPGKVFTKQQIYENGWGDAYITGDNSIMVCISKLRTKLGDSEGEGEGYIRTIRGLGYRLEP